MLLIGPTQHALVIGIGSDYRIDSCHCGDCHASARTLTLVLSILNHIPVLFLWVFDVADSYLSVLPFIREVYHALGGL